MKREIDVDALIATMHKFIDEIGELITTPAPASNHPETRSPNCSATPNSSEIPEECYEAGIAAGNFDGPVGTYWVRDVRTAITAAIHAYRKARPGVVVSADWFNSGCYYTPKQLLAILGSRGITVTD